MLNVSLKNINNLKFDSFNNLLVDYAIENKIFTIIRGLRTLSDFEYEFRMAIMNRNLNAKVETFFLMTDEKYAHISSSLVKEIYFLNGDIKKFVPSNVVVALNNLSNEKNN